jgi:GR25 family glycosyltransferase involved in LPS biosynthesis
MKIKKYKNYKNNKYLLFCIFVLFLSILIYFFIKKYKVKNWRNENFQNNNKKIYTDFIIKELNNITFNPLFMSENDIKLYVISLKHSNRLLHIDNERKKIKEPIFIFDAVKGDDLILEDLLKENILSESFYGKDLVLKKQKKRFREVGCYLSHLFIYNYIKKYDINKYTIIFEDDFSIVIDNFIQKVNESIKIFNDLKIDFDILLLGNIKMNNGKKLSNDIYYINHNMILWGTHAYLINNESINKIFSNTMIIDKPIDIKLKNLDKNNKLKIFVLYPTIVNQNIALPSTIVL